MAEHIPLDLSRYSQSVKHTQSQAASYGSIPTLEAVCLEYNQPQCSLTNPRPSRSTSTSVLNTKKAFLQPSPFETPLLSQMYSFPSLSPPPHCLAACIPCSQLTAWKDCQFDAISCSWIQCSQEHYYGNLISWEIDQIPLTEWNTNVLYGFLGKACVGSTIRYIIYRVVIKKKNYCLISTILFLKIIHLKQLIWNSSIKTKKNPFVFYSSQSQVSPLSLLVGRHLPKVDTAAWFLHSCNNQSENTAASQQEWGILTSRDSPLGYDSFQLQPRP